MLNLEQKLTSNSSLAFGSETEYLRHSLLWVSFFLFHAIIESKRKRGVNYDKEDTNRDK